MCPELKQIFSRKSSPDFNLPKIFWEVTMLSAYCSAYSPSLRLGKKTPRNNATCNRGIYYWLEPGPPALTKGVRTTGPSSLWYLLDTIISWRKWIGYTVGSWQQADWLHSCKAIFVGPTWGFQLSPGRFPFFLLGICWLASIVDWIIMLPRETRPTPNLGCLSWRWLWQPHTYLLATSITLAVLSHYMIFNSLESLLYQNYFLYQKNFTNTPLFPTNNLKLYQPPFSLYLF